jgi:hypothetical protein
VYDNIVSVDLHFVDLSNFIIMAIDKSIHMCGSYCEITYASLEKKPIIVMCKQGRWEVPGFLWGMGLRHQMFFGSWGEVKDYIAHIAYAKTIDDLGRWRFLDYNKVYGRHKNYNLIS